MAGMIVSGTHTSFISLYNPATQRPVTVTGKITNASGQGIVGDPAFAWTVNNQGTIEGNGTTSGFGIQLLDGGTVNNAANGLITGYNAGILIEFAPGTVSNLGTIKGTGANGTGISFFTAGGAVVNGSAAETTALISGVNTAVTFRGGAGNVRNFGTIASTSAGFAIGLHDDGGSVTNGSAASTAALISSAAGHTDVYITGGTGAVTNFATIRGGTVGVFLGDGGRVSNGNSSSVAATIVGDESSSVSIAGKTGTVVNFGALQTLGTLANVALNGGGSVTNGAAGTTSASITGTGTGIYINNAPGTVTNFGHITVTSASAGGGITLEDGGAVSNFGTIQNVDTADTGVYFHGGGNVTNGKGARIAGANNGISIRDGLGTVTNAGSITGSDPTGTGGSGNGIYLIGGGGITNQSGGVIAGHNQGVYARNFAITVTNSGLIETTGTGDGVYLRGGGTITNNAGGTISGNAAGVALGQHGGAVTNRGVIKGVIGFEGGAFHSGANTLINFGTVVSTVAGGVAVEMGSSVGLEKLLVVEKGAVFTGLVEGGGRGEIEFASVGTAAMGGNISGFNTVVLASGGADSLTLANANFGGVSGRMTVVGGNAGNTVNASTVTTGLLAIEGGAGKDVLTGAANGGTVFVFTAKTLSAADKITGSGFNNELDMTTAGTVAAGGVSAVQIFELADGGANSLALTNANFAGLLSNTIQVYGGTGGNTIDASKVTGAGDNLTIYGGAGADALTGGAGNDIFVFTAASLTAGDTVRGGGGNNELLMTTSPK